MSSDIHQGYTNPVAILVYLNNTIKLCSEVNLLKACFIIDRLIAQNNVQDIPKIINNLAMLLSLTQGQNALII